MSLGNKIICVGSFEPAHDKNYNKTCATREDSDQSAHPRSLIRVFADRMRLLQPPGYPKKDERELLPYWLAVQADLSLCWSNRSYCRFCRALARFFSCVFNVFTLTFLMQFFCCNCSPFVHSVLSVVFVFHAFLSFVCFYTRIIYFFFFFFFFKTSLIT